MKMKRGRTRRPSKQFTKRKAATNTAVDSVALGQRERASKLTQRLLEIGRTCAVRLKEPFRSIDHGDHLYDDQGLPN
jgi:antitoxin VapB